MVIGGVLVSIMMAVDGAGGTGIITRVLLFDKYRERNGRNDDCEENAPKYFWNGRTRDFADGIWV